MVARPRLKRTSPFGRDNALIDPSTTGDQNGAVGPEGPGRIGARERVPSVGLAIILLGSLVVGAVLFGSGDGESLADRLEAADGVLVAAEHDRVRIRLYEPIDGHHELELAVRPADRSQLDLPHLRDHVRWSLPTRLYFERQGDEYVAREAIDLPAGP